MKTHESGENYLETILILRERNSEVRSIDIANELGFSRPSISRAVKVLKKDHCIDMDGYGKITLTEKGEAIAGRIYERHLMLTRYLVALGVSEKVAADDACRLEHVLSEQSFVKIVEHYRNALSGDAAARGGAGGVRGASGGASGKGAVAAAGSSAAAGGGAAKAKIGAGANPGAYEDEYVTAGGDAGAKAGASKR